MAGITEQQKSAWLQLYSWRNKYDIIIQLRGNIAGADNTHVYIEKSNIELNEFYGENAIFEAVQYLKRINKQ
ncbi:MAG: hypothetical protein KF900_14045 [Bacteroidetes bacterium]|nr:hypothetical protein [Bacteroidota bacterium]